MKKVWAICGSVVMVLVLAFLAFQLIQIRDDLNSTKDDLNAKTAELSTLHDKIDTTTDLLTETNDELAKTKVDLSQTTADLDATKATLNETIVDLDKTNADLEAAKANSTQLDAKLNSTTASLNTANDKIDSLTKDLELYKETFGEVFENSTPFIYIHNTEPPSWSFQMPATPTAKRYLHLVNNPLAKNPTYAELLDFLQADITDTYRYLLDYYVCGNFAETVHNNAEAKGIRTAFVLIYYDTGPGHAINAFLTTDKGLVYIDCTGSSSESGPSSNDTYVYKLKMGSNYQQGFLFETQWGYSLDERTVTDLNIYW